MKEFIDKLIERLEEESNNAEAEMHILADSEYSLPCQFDRIDIEDCKSKTFCEAIQIVNELAEEYKLFGNSEQVKVSEMPTGWIPCSERLPEVNKKVLAFDVFSGISIEKLEEDEEFIESVIAWMPLPTAPYTEGE